MCRSCPVVDWAERMPTDRVSGARKAVGAVSDHVVWYDGYSKEHAPLVGGKNASLGELTLAGLPVPPGFAVTVDAYQRMWEDPALVEDVNTLLVSIDHGDYGTNRRISTEIRALIEAAPFPKDVADEINDAYRALCRHCQVDDVAVAVRSSATAEDLPDASFAGQQDTFLWIRGADAVVAHVRRCWSSLFTDRAIAYRHSMGFGHDAVAMSVGVQKMVDPKAAGVAFTLNPSTGDRSQIAIDASWGLGEAVVSGEVNPDNYLFDKVLREVVQRTISTKAVEYRLSEDGVVEKVPVEADRQCVACLSDDEVRAVAVLARRTEKHYGCPQDIEWAIDRHLPEDDCVVLLQSRPETVWSQRAVTPLSASHATGVASIVSTLLSPIHKTPAG
jgi:pyruvate,water dikinase